MPYYHIYAEWEDEIGSRFGKNENFSEEQVKMLSTKIEKGLPFILKNIKVNPYGITKLEIWKTANIAIMSKKWDWIRATGEIVTNDFVIPLPVRQTEFNKVSPASSRETENTLSKNVFIVHGKDHAPMKALKAMLIGFGLNPIVLHEKASGGLTLVEKLEKYSRDLGFAFVILTPDDIGGSAEDILGITMNKVTESTRPLTVIIDEIYKINNKTTRFKLLELFSQFFTNRARQNVVLEFGYFMGLLDRDRVCCLYKGDVELPSDMHGIVYIPFKDSVEEARNMIIKELKEAGYEIKV